mgnify:CR=1 FL=1
MSNSTSSLPTYVINAIAAGYSFECPCGELLRSIAAARTCRKCRSYSHFGGRYVTNVATGELVYGTVPSEEEWAQAKLNAAAAEAREAEESAYWAEQARVEALEKVAEAQEASFWKAFFKYDDIAESLGY